MKFIESQVLTTVSAGEARLNTYGWFANDIESLRNAVTGNRRTLHAIYDRLHAVLKPNLERRFSSSVGNFSLYYPLDKVNEERN